MDKDTRKLWEDQLTFNEDTLLELDELWSSYKRTTWALVCFVLVMMFIFYLVLQWHLTG